MEEDGKAEKGKKGKASKKPKKGAAAEAEETARPSSEEIVSDVVSKLGFMIQYITGRDNRPARAVPHRVLSFANPALDCVARADGTGGGRGAEDPRG